LSSKNQQVNVLLSLQIQVQVAVATALSLTPARICDARLAHAAEAGNHRAAIRFVLELTLNCSQHFVGGGAGELVKPPRKWPGLDE
jgi:hypothetical protein